MIGKVQEKEDCIRKLFLTEPHLLTRDCKVLVHDLNLSKNHAEVSGSRLKGGIFSTKILQYASSANAKINSKNSSPKKMIWYFCNNVCSVIQVLGHQCDPTEWRLFLDSSKVCLKAVILHNRNKFPSVPVTHATNIKESYENTKLGLENIQFEKYN